MSYQINFRVDIVGGRGGVPQCWADPTILSFTSDKNQSVDEEGLEWKRRWQLWFSYFLCKQNKRGKESLLLLAAILRGRRGGCVTPGKFIFLLTESLSKDLLQPRTSTRSGRFTFLGSGFA